MPVEGITTMVDDEVAVELKEEDKPRMPSKIKLEKKYVPEHPYCTNWPMTKKKYEQLEFDFKEDQVAPI